MTRHEARVALAIHIANDALKRFLDKHMFQAPSFGMANTCAEYIKCWLKPFIMSNDIEVVKVQEMIDIDHLYPRLDVVIVPKRAMASYVKVDFKQTLREDIHEN